MSIFGCVQGSSWCSLARLLSPAAILDTVCSSSHDWHMSQVLTCIPVLAQKQQKRGSGEAHLSCRTKEGVSVIERVVVVPLQPMLVWLATAPLRSSLTVQGLTIKPALRPLPQPSLHGDWLQASALHEPFHHPVVAPEAALW